MVVDFPIFLALWNRLQGQGTPAVHLTIARWLAERWNEGDRRLLLMAFRSCGKSTLVGLFAAWLLARAPDLRIMVVSADAELARKMVRNVRRIVERHPLTRHLRPRRADQWGADRFTVERPSELRDPSMLARGVTGNVTGSRADVIIHDDVEVPNTAATATRRENLRARLAEAEFVLVPGGLSLFVGTPHSAESLYAEATGGEAGTAYLTGYKRLVLPLVDSNGNSAWPERFPPDAIERLRRRSGPARFRSQMLLEPADVADGRFSHESLVWYSGDLDLVEGGGGRLMLSIDGTPLVSAACWWDPAFSGSGDESVVAAVFMDDTGGYWLHRIAYLPKTAGNAGDEATAQCRAVARFAADLHLPAITVETNGLGRFLPGLLRRELSEAGVGAGVVEATSRTPKERRIVDAFDAVIAARALKVHDRVRDTPFLREFTEWRADRRGDQSDDGLDAVAGCLLSQPARLRPARRPGRREWRTGAVARAVESGFDPLA